jgi:hypothetical protein
MHSQISTTSCKKTRYNSIYRKRVVYSLELAELQLFYCTTAKSSVKNSFWIILLLHCKHLVRKIEYLLKEKMTFLTLKEVHCDFSPTIAPGRLSICDLKLKLIKLSKKTIYFSLPGSGLKYGLQFMCLLLHCT